MNSTTIINTLIRKRGYKRYLALGIEGDHIVHVKCQHAVGVDQFSEHATFKSDTDAFFALLDAHPEPLKYDIIFIDGLHTESQTTKDFDNSLRYLADEGTIVLHNCNPPSEFYQRPHSAALLTRCMQWTGDVWRVIVHLRATRDDLDVFVVDADYGCGIVRRRSSNTIEVPTLLTYTELSRDRNRLLGLVKSEDFLTKIET